MLYINVLYIIFIFKCFFFQIIMHILKIRYKISIKYDFYSTVSNFKALNNNISKYNN